MKIALISIVQEGHPPIGLAYLASYLREYIDTKVDIRIIDHTYVDIMEELSKERFDLIGISSMTIEYAKAIDIAKKIKEMQDVPVIIGGTHISTLSESLKSCFDLGVIGEGEITFFEIVKSLLKNGRLDYDDLESVDGLIFFKDGLIHKTKPRQSVMPLDSVPLPAIDLLNKDYFKHAMLTTFGEFGRHGVLLTSRGCPYDCVFCSTSLFWDKIRFHSPEYVMKQIAELVNDYGVTHIQIWDDLFVANKKRFKEIVHLFEKSDLKGRVQFNCQPRVNLINDEICDLLKRMDCNLVLFGFESGSDRMLSYLKGNLPLEQNKRAIKTCVRHGLKVQGSVIFGSPTETLDEMRETLDFLDFAYKEGVDRIWSFVMTPFPGTKIWDIALERGKVSNDMDWELLSHQAIDNPLLLDPDIDKKEFVKIFYAGRGKLNRFKWNKVYSFLRTNPLDTVIYMLANPIRCAKMLFSKEDIPK